MATSLAGEGTSPAEGLRQNTPDVHALVGARIVVSPGQTLDRGTLVIRNGRVVAVGENIAPPADAVLQDYSGKTIYPGLWDAYTEAGARATADDGHDHDAPPAAAKGASTPAPHGGAPYWNPNVSPQEHVAEHYQPAHDENKKLRSQGIAVRLLAPSKGIIKGKSVLVDTSDRTGRASIISEEAALHARLMPTGPNRVQFPGSPMGAYTLVRQAFYDADWYARAWEAHRAGKDVPRPERNDALEALQGYAGNGKLVIVDADDELYFLRADAIGREFRLNVAVRGSGDEYRRLADVKATGRTVIVPLHYPPPPRVKTPEDARYATLERLMDWDLAPENAGRLAKAGVPLAFSSQGLKDRGTFLAGVRKAVYRGLSEEDALRALTVTPAQLFGEAERSGTLDVGQVAHLVVTDGNLFAEETKVLQTWVSGVKYDVSFEPLVDARGSWEIAVQAPKQAGKLTLALEGLADKLQGKLQNGTKGAKLEHVSIEDARVGFTLDGKELGLADGLLRMSGVVTGQTIDGSGIGPDGVRFTWTAKRLPGSLAKASETKPAEKAAAPKPPAAEDPFGPAVALAPAPQPSIVDPADRTALPKVLDAAGGKKKPEDEDPKKKKEPPPKSALFPVNYPLGAFGVAEPPQAPAAVLFKNATVWTSGPRGTIPNCSVLVKQGKIVAVGPDVKAPADLKDVLVVDLAGKHLSPGILDCHSHSATDGGINEPTQSVTCEVRIGDFVDCDDIQIYRQLAGGVTTINVLHGSANTIGGQNQVLKLRWGHGPAAMKFSAAPQGVKFALGENVKQANWGDNFTKRYPQSRMGVEQVVRDSFRAARDYQRHWATWRPGQSSLPPRVDLELEALTEILDGKRLVHCHSYRQDEILAFLRVCEEHKVRVATLQHILEGYKVADVMKKHGAGGSAFSDWWAYKFEVIDAIPYNGAVMHEAGVLVSFNSDSPELARRLNTEAAKAVKYGGVSEVDALRFVTLNPAKQLGIDKHVGSIEPGKDADLAVWSESPLSSLAICEQTWIDGARYFDREDDRQRRAENERMKAALIARAIHVGDEAGESIKERLKRLWDREDAFCHHGHDHDGHGHNEE